MQYETEIENDDNFDPCDIGGEIYNAVKDMTIQTVRIMQRHEDLSPLNHLYVCLSAAAGAISVAAKLMSYPNDVTPSELAEWAGQPPTREAVLAAIRNGAWCEAGERWQRMFERITFTWRSKPRHGPGAS